MYCKELITEGLDKNNRLIWDTETIGLYGRTRLVQVRQGDISYAYDCFYVNIEDIKWFFKDWHLVGHNIHYDLSCRDFMRWIPRAIDDTMVAARLQYPMMTSFSLGNLVDALKLGKKGEEGKSDWSQWNLSDEQLKYAEMDTQLTELLFAKITDETLNSNVYKLDIESIRLACDYQYRGLPIRKDSIQLFRRQLQKEMAEADKLLPKGLNVASSLQVRNFLNSDTGDKIQLTLMGDPRSDAIIQKRHCLKQLTYLDDLEKHDTAKAITNPLGAKTGRFTSKGSDEIPGTFNLQQIPANMKSLFGIKDGFIVTADYPALEIWMCCAIIKDAFMYKALLNKADLHKDTAIKMFKTDNISKDLRTIAKMCNFTLLYGAGANALTKVFYSRVASGAISKDMADEHSKKAEQYRRAWLDTYKDIAKHNQEAYDYFSNNKYRIVSTPLGRKIRTESATSSLNFPVQGGGAECTKLAIVLLKKEGINICNTVHDSIALTASTMSEAEEYAKALKWAMEESFRRVIKNCKANDLSLAVDYEISEFYT